MVVLMFCTVKNFNLLFSVIYFQGLSCWMEVWWYGRV